MMKKEVTSLLARNPLVSGLMTQLTRLDRTGANQLRIFTYHRLGEPAVFEAQMRYLAQNYYVASMHELLQVHAGGHTLPPRAVMVTFDDAYQDFAEVAWPIMQRYSMPAAVFVATGFPDQPGRVFWWDRLEAAATQTERRDELSTPVGDLPLAVPSQRLNAYKKLRDYVKMLPHEVAMAYVNQFCEELGNPSVVNDVLGWDELRRLAREGVTFGAHTQTHPLMNRIPVGEAVAEAVSSQQDLAREIGSVLPIFAYPNGSFSQEVVDGLRAEGFEMAFTTGPGANQLPHTDWLRLRRNNISPKSNLTMLQARLLQSATIL
ncbi:MAG: polysaccharide deacetylase family protein [Caldilineaceae bacterium]|nr:polysaccharide deacetylase family protein [Caldilineaceae bacterium]